MTWTDVSACRENLLTTMPRSGSVESFRKRERSVAETLGCSYFLLPPTSETRPNLPFDGIEIDRFIVRMSFVRDTANDACTRESIGIAIVTLAVSPLRALTKLREARPVAGPAEHGVGQFHVAQACTVLHAGAGLKHIADLFARALRAEELGAALRLGAIDVLVAQGASVRRGFQRRYA